MLCSRGNTIALVLYTVVGIFLKKLGWALFGEDTAVIPAQYIISHIYRRSYCMEFGWWVGGWVGGGGGPVGNWLGFGLGDIFC